AGRSLRGRLARLRVAVPPKWRRDHTKGRPMTRKLLERTALVCLALWPSPASSRDGGESAASGEAQLVNALQGTWVLESTELAGMKIGKAKGLDVELTLRGDKLSMRQGPGREEGAYRVNEGRSPKSLDLIAPKSTRQDAVQCIYRVEGDTLKVGFFSGAPAKGRPAGFDAPDLLVLTLKRRK